MTRLRPSEAALLSSGGNKKRKRREETFERGGADSFNGTGITARAAWRMDGHHSKQFLEWPLEVSPVAHLKIPYNSVCLSVSYR